MKWIKNMEEKQRTETKIVTGIKRRYTIDPVVVKQIIQDYLEKLHTKTCESVVERQGHIRGKQLTKIDTRRNRKLECSHNYFEKLSL